MATPDRPLAGRLAVITGASRGIGRAMAEAFAAAGCSLALCARDMQPVSTQDIAERHAVEVLAQSCDVRRMCV